MTNLGYISGFNLVFYGTGI